MHRQQISEPPDPPIAAHRLRTQERVPRIRTTLRRGPKETLREWKPPSPPETRQTPHAHVNCVSTLSSNQPASLPASLPASEALAGEKAPSAAKGKRPDWRLLSPSFRNASVSGSHPPSASGRTTRNARNRPRASSKPAQQEKGVLCTCPQRGALLYNTASPIDHQISGRQAQHKPDTKQKRPPVESQSMGPFVLDDRFHR